MVNSGLELITNQMAIEIVSLSVNKSATRYYLRMPEVSFSFFSLFATMSLCRSFKDGVRCFDWDGNATNCGDWYCKCYEAQKFEMGMSEEEDSENEMEIIKPEDLAQSCSDDSDHEMEDEDDDEDGEAEDNNKDGQATTAAKECEAMREEKAMRLRMRMRRAKAMRLRMRMRRLL
jgi:hypothetical protein